MDGADSHRAAVLLLLPWVLLFGCAGPELGRALPLRPVLPVSAAGEMEALVAQKAMLLQENYCCGGSLAVCCRRFICSHWEDYMESCRLAALGDARCCLSCRYTDAARILAAYCRPALRSRLTLRELRALALAERWAAELRPYSDREKMSRLHDAWARRLHFVRGQDSAADFLLTGRACCAGLSRAAFLVWSMAGLPAHIVCGRAPSPHVWNMVCVQGRWLHVDITLDEGHGLRVPQRYSGIGAEEMRRSHSW